MGNTLKKVVFVCGAGHSGSTLLGLILGSHSDCFYAGEAKNSCFIGKENRPIQKRTCKVCGFDCPVWGNLTLEDSKILYEKLSFKTQKPIIIDSTKDVAWIAEKIANMKNSETQIFLLFIQRDGRAVINSWIRKNPEKDVREQIQKWIQNMRDANKIFNSFASHKLKIRYEELATNPQQEMMKICNFLNIEYEPKMLKFYESEHHPIGGNNGTQSLLIKVQKRKINDLSVLRQSRIKLDNYPQMEYYKKHELGISLDLRWREELAPSVERLFEEMAGKENAEMKWDA